MSHMVRWVVSRVAMMAGTLLAWVATDSFASQPRVSDWPEAAHGVVSGAVGITCVGRVRTRTVTVRLRVDGSGYVSTVDILDGDLGGTALAICVRRELNGRKLRIHPSRPGGVTVTRAQTYGCATWPQGPMSPVERSYCLNGRVRRCRERGSAVLAIRGAAVDVLRIDGRAVKPSADGTLQIPAGYRGITVQAGGKLAEAEVFACPGETHEVSYDGTTHSLVAKKI